MAEQATHGQDTIVNNTRFADTHWTDLRFPPGTTKLDSTNPPDETIYKGGQVLAFSSSVNNKLYFTAQMPHGWKLGSTIDVHLHIVLPVAGSGAGVENVKFDVTHSIAMIGGTFPAETTITATRDVQNDPADKHIYFDISDIDMSSFAGLSTVILFSLERDTGVANDYANDIYIVEADVHYQMDSPGSDEELAK